MLQNLRKSFRFANQRARGALQLGNHKINGMEKLEPRQLLASDVILSEIVSSNDEGIRDEDGQHTDWIELYNTGHEDADISGWFLTDRENDRTKWQVPDGVTIEPGGTLLIYASGKDRSDPNNNLHTNFQLARNGEYLGLYEADGRTVAAEFDLPQQYTDVSYGVSQALETRQFTDGQNDARVLLPSSAGQDIDAATWTSVDFDDGAWQQSKAALGYDDDTVDGDFNELIDPEGQLAMRNNASSAYVRTSFDIEGDEIPIFNDMDLSVNYDDGFVAYLNGTEILSVNAPETLAWDSVAPESHGGIGDAIAYDDFGSADVQNEFTLKGNAGFEGNVLRLTPSAIDQNGAAWRTEPVQFQSDFTFSASMKFDVHSPGGGLAEGDADGIGGEGMTFVLQSNDDNVLGLGGSSLGLENTGMTFVAIELDSNSEGAFDPDSSMPSHVGINTNTAGSIGRARIDRFNGNAFFPGNPGPGSNFQYLWVDYSGETQQLDVYYSTSDAKPETPTVSATINLAEHFGNEPALFAGFTATTSNIFNGHDVVDFNIVTGVGELGRQAETFNLREHVGLLQTGKNVLAFHGLNTDAADEDFLLIPQLSAQEVIISSDSGYFAVATPGALNGEASLPPSAGVIFSETTKVFSEAFELTIRGEQADAEIRYTTDGTIPNEESTLYTGPMTIDASTRIRAVAVEPGRSAGPISSAGFTHVSSQLVNFENGNAFESNLPIIVIDSFGNRRVNTDSVRLVASEALFIAPGEDGRANLFDEPDYAGKIGARIRGQSSQGWAKKQYAVEILNEGPIDDSRPFSASLGDDKAVSFFGLPAESDWVLNGPYSDKTQLNNYLTFNWYNEIGTYAPRTRLVEVFVNADGDPDEAEKFSLDFDTDYRGTYVLLEKIKVDENRIDIEELTPADTAEPDITGGYVWKKDKTGAEDLNITTGNRRQEVRIIEPSCTDVTRNRETRLFECASGEITNDQISWLQNHLTEFEDVLYSDNFADPDEGYAKYIDVDSWVDTWLMVEFTKNIDGFRLSTYYFKDRGGKIQQGPAWDYNLSLGNGNYLEGAYPEGWYNSAYTNRPEYPYWDRLFEDPAFEQAISDRWTELRQNEFTTENLLADVDAAVNLLSDGNPNLEKPAEGEPSNPIARNFERWTTRSYGTDIYHWPNCFFGQGGCPRSPLPGGGRPEEYGDYIFIMKWFIENRAEWMDSQLSAPIAATPSPGVVEAGSQITLTGPNGSQLFYTIDGTDPQFDSPSVMEYTGPITVDGNIELFVRSLSNGNWSQGFRGNYISDIPELQITEINFNPHGPSAEELAALPGVRGEDFEFVEIKNLGNEAGSLLGVSFAAGIGFDGGSSSIPAGEYGVLVKNVEAFQLRYGTDANVVGEYTGALNNAGEQLHLIDASGATLSHVTYGDGQLWPASADGVGATLVLDGQTPESATDLNKYYYWRGSTNVGGTPGGDPAAAPGIVINEVLSNSADPETDSIELLNTTDSSIDVGGWFVSDSAENLQKYQIPAGTTIAPNAMLVLTEEQFNTDPENNPNSFALNSSNGDDVWITIANDAGQTSQFVDDVHFVGSLSGETFGRYPDGQGRLAPMSPSIGQANSAPRVGPVLISEVHYHPADPSAAALEIYPDLIASDLEFIEIHNPTTGSIDLTDWRIRGDVDLNFEPDTMLNPSETVVITSFDPTDEDNLGRLTAFRSEHGINQNVRLLGGYQAQLGGNGGRVTLLSRDQSLADQPVVLPLISEDEVVYDDRGAWPVAADGAGASLQRVNSASYGNSSSSWIATNPTPGSVSFGDGIPGDLNGDGMVDATDINSLCGEINAAQPNADFDLNGDGAVNIDDHQFLVVNILGTSAGDSNLDGVFDSGDLVALFTRGHYEDGIAGNSGWGEGDFNCDGEFDTGDLVAAFEAGAYVSAALTVDRVVANTDSDVGAALQRLDHIEMDESVELANRTLANQLARREATLELQDAEIDPVRRDEFFADIQDDDANMDDSLVDDLLDL